MDAVISADGCSVKLRLDLETENGHMAEMQQFLHFPANQAEMDSVIWDNLLDKSLIQFCFLHTIQVQ